MDAYLMEMSRILPYPRVRRQEKVRTTTHRPVDVTTVQRHRSLNFWQSITR
jgi:hypothetical protein